MLVRVNKGFLIAFERYGLERLCDVMMVKRQSIYNIRNGKTQLSLGDAARLHDELKIGWVNFKQYETVVPAGMVNKEITE
jgi:transcriptional regulator with XRE-family HTH domain